MRYFYLLVGNIVGLAIAGHFGLNWLQILMVVADCALWRHWIKSRS